MKSKLVQVLCFFLCGTQILLAQTVETMSVVLQQAGLADALKSIEAKSGIHILFDYRDIESYQVTCKLDSCSFERAMAVLLLDKPLIYRKVRENTYVIRKTEAKKGTKVVECSLSGIVTDSLYQPVEAAVVSVLKQEDGFPMSQTITSAQGRFSLKAAGKVQLYVSCLGYNPYLSEPFNLEKDTAVRIHLQSANILLDNVLIIGEKQHPSVRVINGNTVFFPKNSGILAGGTALDILRKTPGVLVDGNDKVS